jgi:hypothetical protein
MKPNESSDNPPARPATRSPADPPADDPPLPRPPRAGDPAAVTGKDVERAVDWWKANCPPGARGLIDAGSSGEEPSDAGSA